MELKPSNPRVATTITRSQAAVLANRLAEQRRHIQVVAGPRQVGKTTLIRQVLAKRDAPCHYASADDALLADAHWLTMQWRLARELAGGRGCVLAIDEVHRVANWSATVKALWDEDSRNALDLRVVLSGSAPILVGRGLGESLAGRFERVVVPHWSWPETHAAFGHTLDEFVAYGGYPGAAPLIDDPPRWTQYVRDALIEATVSRDVLQLARVDKPALLRRLFDLACAYAGQELSYTKMLGQLQDPGNATTLAWYLDLLATAGMACGLPKFAGEVVRQRGSSPKLAVFAPGLRTAVLGQRLSTLRADPEQWGHQVEACVAAHLLNTSRGTDIEVQWWRERGAEVDYVLCRGSELLAIEVKSTHRKQGDPGLATFAKAYPKAKTLLVGGGGLQLGEFLARPAAAWMDFAGR